jgi:hypothetical protein
MPTIDHQTPITSTTTRTITIENLTSKKGSK